MVFTGGESVQQICGTSFVLRFIGSELMNCKVQIVLQHVIRCKELISALVRRID